MSFNPILASTDLNSLTAQQIIEQKKKIAEQNRQLDIVLKQKMEEQRAGFVQNVLEQVIALEMDPLEFIQKFKEAGAMGEAAISAKDIFEMVNTSPAKLEAWFSEFNKLKNEHSRQSKTPFFKLGKMTRAGLSDSKFVTIYFEDIKGGEKGLQALAQKIAPNREAALAKLAEGIDSATDERVKTVLDMLYPEPAPADKKKK